MLISFSVENFRSIRDRQSLIMHAAKGDNHLAHSHVVEKAGNSILKTAAIYGANASGKSNVINAMIWMKRFIVEAISEKVESPEIPVEPFRLQRSSVKKPSVFEIEFLVGEILYRYGFAVNTNGVQEEWLFRKRPKSKPAEIFSRQKQEIKTNTSQEKGLKPFAERTRPNTLFLKVCAEFNFSFAEEIMNWLRRFRNISGLSDEGFVRYTAKRISKESHREELLEFIRKADFNICDIRSELGPLTDEDIPPILSSEIRKKLLSSSVSKSDILTSHSVFDNSGKIVATEEFDLKKDESEGTRKFVALAGPILHTIEEGSILLIDEFEARLHPNLTKSILQWFQGPQNRKGAQIVFATHDTGLMTPELMRRDQIWFCDKDEQGATTLFCLDEFDKQDVRNTTKFNRQYLQGIFGAVPRIALEEFAV
ncbi:ATP-binding protein [Pelagicoccus sp. SDUM812005]|uniref:AAA family ATPase n=1 Tax=Pelagicoccus sp. SDUM812005 TaxID=3041257 RepID=UPI00280FD113|nr:ATP-binding protein [Pelagicoccus sp. SDUM812005]MDQ8183632.1 ATP-binding protein [Pelagicoccus sp. SDUM812005]